MPALPDLTLEAHLDHNRRVLAAQGSGGDPEAQAPLSAPSSPPAAPAEGGGACFERTQRSNGCGTLRPVVMDQMTKLVATPRELTVKVPLPKAKSPPLAPPIFSKLVTFMIPLINPPLIV
jgi:hypothetical protein